MMFNKFKLIQFIKENDDERMMYNKFVETLNQLNSKYYPNISIGSMTDKPDIILNDHGYDHIMRVLEHASNLADEDKVKLNLTEAYILAISILFHDVGNIFSREGHENDYSILTDLKKHYYLDDTILLITIREIVQAHGGKTLDGRKDKISCLDNTRKIKSDKVRIKILAALLRFADELADDKDRANNVLLELGKIGEKSEVYHVYSSVLEPASIDLDSNKIELQYYIEKKHLIEEASCGTFLIDEIYNRLYKMHLERMYCMRFLNKYITINSIQVDIDIIDDMALEKLLTLNVFENGYPDEDDCGGLFNICTELCNGDGRKDGKYYKEHFDSKEVANVN